MLSPPKRVGDGVHLPLVGWGYKSDNIRNSMLVSASLQTNDQLELTVHNWRPPFRAVRQASR